MTQLNDFLQLIRDRLALSSLISRYVMLKKRGREHSGLCPFHQEKGASFTVNDEKNFYHCFGCGAHGDHFGFLMQRLNMPFMEVVEFLANEAGLTVPKFGDKGGDAKKEASKETGVRLYQVMDAACVYYEQQLRVPDALNARDYLRKRGVTGKTVQQFRLGFAPSFGLKKALLDQGFSENELVTAGLLIEPESGRDPYERFRDRLIFPIQDIKGRVIAFGGRIIGKGEPKYLNSPDTPLFNKGHLLYAHHQALAPARTGVPYLIVEGYMDAISLHQVGLVTAVAPLGTALTLEQIRLLWRSGPTPVLCFDGDPAGVRAASRAALRALEIVRPGYSLSFCFLPDGEDPDSLVQRDGGQGFRQLLASPRPLIDILWQHLSESMNLTTPEQKSQGRQDILNLCKQIKDPETQHFYREDLMQRLNSEIYKHRRHGYEPKKQKNLLVSAPLYAGGNNKFNDAHKILLATLINHPTLISELSDQIMGLMIEDVQLNELRNIILDICQDPAHIHSVVLIDALRRKGFDEVLTHLLSQDTYLKAPFSKPEVALEKVLIGWQEIWHVIQVQESLRDETRQTATDLKSSLDEQTWVRLKQLKKSMSV